MMKSIDLRTPALSAEDGEYIFGKDHTGSHACYMIYGVLKPGEKDRLVKPGAGHEEMVLAANQNLEVTGAFSGRLAAGCAFHIEGEDTAYLSNPGSDEAVYVVAGGHSEEGHHH
jgi:hypothetical protein